ncbi:MAG: hypothetical protein AAF915_05890 [Cyanobacteria bacterium P01_D01_bin.50]
MNFTRLISFINRSLRVVITGLLCVTLLFSNALPATAIGANKSAPTEGTDQLKEIEKEARKVGNPNAEPRSLQATQAKAEKGLNAVQGDADKDKMYRPDNSEATTVKEEVKGFLGNITGN